MTTSHTKEYQMNLDTSKVEMQPRIKLVINVKKAWT